MRNNKLKIFNDPIYGFITIPSALIFDLIEHPYFQRLRRISQMGMSYLVYPGAHHTRFHHALGSMFLMQKAVRVLRFKGVEISDEEEEALYVAILLHDIGHGPFSHAMEHSIVNGISHEVLSLKFMESLNSEFDGALSLAIQVFKGEYSRNFMVQLISSQIDMDRADYLKRDSFYTGVAEGNINSERLITMLNVVDDQLVIEEKAVYSIEKFLVARRFMYWQVYLHKTGIVAEQLLTKVLKRAKELVSKGNLLSVSKPLMYFLENEVHMSHLNQKILQTFALLDDYDIISALKSWQFHDDKVLSQLSKIILDRRLLKIKLKNKPIAKSLISARQKALRDEWNLSNEELDYFVFSGSISHRAYDPSKDPIGVLMNNGKVKSLDKVSDQLNVKTFSKAVSKHYICFPQL